MNSSKKRRVFYNRSERLQKAAAEQLLTDPAALPSHRAQALRTIRRVQEAAESRAFDRAVSQPEPQELTVDDLVSALEKAEKQPSQLQQNKGSEKGPNAIKAILGPSTTAKASEVTQTAQSDLEAVQAIANGKMPLPAVLVPPPEPTCKICAAPAPDPHMNWPMGDPNGRRLCPDCYRQMCSIAARSEPVKIAPLDWAADFAAKRSAYSSDYQTSRAIWAEQDRERADQQAQESIERDRAEVQYHAARASWIQDGGKL